MVDQMSSSEAADTQPVNVLTIGFHIALIQVSLSQSTQLVQDTQLLLALVASLHVLLPFPSACVSRDGRI